MESLAKNFLRLCMAHPQCEECPLMAWGKSGIEPICRNPRIIEQLCEIEDWTAKNKEDGAE